MSRVLDWDITVPFRWTCGPVYGRFLGGLKEKQLLGFECPRCQEVYCPPQDICPRCGGDFDPEQCRPLGEEGDLVSFTVVEANLFGPRPDDEYLRRRIHPADLGEHPLLWPPDPPYAIVMVRLDGAANNFLHLARGEDLSRLQVGCRMRAVWKEEREGFLLDLDRFTVL
ncbi:MAG TPA: zinc ribbon domain-containing protein [Bacillota bacterium]|jgi:uncharacterized OB-fold protein|nr:hypothetical protein [Bacillota bacterium]HOB87209.1 zinc ribbon domain-containing protein [Bacillota bacterium]HOP68506.1 zinc ribbon domain-containing protein [Bacillota bacterium]HPT33265.1 zinc ribbon domain-containing protein [Bacillota bacterium]HPZ65656.1 zinc ribbon domain-containing protein [Bacillota bacterium]